MQAIYMRPITRAFSANHEAAGAAQETGFRFSAPKQAAKKPRKEHKIKVVRDSFTLPQSEHQKIAEIKAVCLNAGLHVNINNVLRYCLKALAELNAAQLKRALSNLEKF